MRYTYPASLEPDEDGRILVRFPDLPEALTDGADETEALVEAVDCLSEAMAGRIRRGEDLPAPSAAQLGMRDVAPDSIIALKAAVYITMRRQRVSMAELAGRLSIDERRAGRLVDPRARSSLADLEQALDALGYSIGIEVREKRIA